MRQGHLCHTLFSSEGCGPEDKTGCRLPAGHTEPHEFVDTKGLLYRWETDWECDCEHCRQNDGDWCTIYWRVE